MIPLLLLAITNMRGRLAGENPPSTVDELRAAALEMSPELAENLSKRTINLKPLFDAAAAALIEKKTFAEAYGKPVNPRILARLEQALTA